MNPQHIHAGIHEQVYTDGTCDLPKDQNCCRAAWAAIRLANANYADPSYNDFEVLQVSHVQGSQTINRGELASVAWVSQFYAQQQLVPMLDLFTDSSFVERIVRAIANQTLDPHQFDFAHYDLVQVVQSTWNPVLFQINKVKSHCQLSHDADSAS